MDFSGQNLRGHNFRGQDLTGANFSHADIRGANFSNAILRGASFTGAKAGLQKRWIILQITIALLLSYALGFMTSFMLFCLTVIFMAESVERYTALPGVIFIAVLGIFAVAAARQDRMAEVFRTGAGHIAGILGSAALYVVDNDFLSSSTVLFYLIFNSMGSTTFSLIVPKVINSGVSVTFGLSILSVCAHIARRALVEERENNISVRMVAIDFAAIGGTSFCGADLTDADFTRAILKSTNFNHTKQKQTVLHQVCWSDAKKLDRARLGTSILANPAVCELLITRNGYKKSYKNVDLHNANLKGINLECADLEQANLSHAALQQANLNHANLTKTLAVGANFSQAYLTGACLESWNIDHTTTLDRVDCQFVYLLEQPNAIGSRERRPHDPDKVFQPGDFEKLYKKIMDTVQILLRDGMNREAFAAAFQELMQKNPDITYESILAIERKGSDALLTLEVAPDADKAKVSQDFLKPYEDEVRQLQAKVDHLQQLRSADIKDIALELARHPLNVTNQAVGTGTMQETNDSSRNINIGNIGGNFNASGQALSLGDISGNVTNTINQLPESTTEQPGIKELLTELQTAIASATELSEKGKTSALEQVKTLAEVGQNPEQPEKKSLGEKAMIFLKGTIANLPDTAKLAEASSKLLPLIAKALGLPM